MVSTIDKLMTHSTDAFFHTKEYKEMIEDHLTDIRKDVNSIEINIENKLAGASDGDFYTLLDLYKINPNHYWLILRVNDMTSPFEYRNNRENIRIPREDFINSLVKRLKTTQSMSSKRKK